MVLLVDAVLKNKKKIPSCSVPSLTFADVMEQAAVSKGMCGYVVLT